MNYTEQGEVYAFAYRYLHGNGADPETCHNFANYVVDRWRNDDYDNWLHNADMSSESRRYSVSLVTA